MTTAIIIGAILAVCGIFALGVYHGQHHGRQEREDLADTLDATMRNFTDYVEDHANTYPPTIWSDAVPPGGQVCAVPVSDRPGEICGCRSSPSHAPSTRVPASARPTPRTRPTGLARPLMSTSPTCDGHPGSRVARARRALRPVRAGRSRSTAARVVRLVQPARDGVERSRDTAVRRSSACVIKPPAGRCTGRARVVGRETCPAPVASSTARATREPGCPSHGRRGAHQRPGETGRPRTRRRPCGSRHTCARGMARTRPASRRSRPACRRQGRRRPGRQAYGIGPDGRRVGVAWSST